jgi:transcriptional regulator with XRE-family HTH domain
MASAILNKKKFAKQLGQRIRQIREQKGISLKSFETKEYAIDRSNLSKIENGTRLPSSYTLYIISMILDVDVRDFFEKTN